MNTNTQIHIEYLGEYVFKSIILEPAAHVEYIGEYFLSPLYWNQLFRTVERGLRELGFGEGLHQHFSLYNDSLTPTLRREGSQYHLQPPQ
jgi:hypothetical protein